MKPVPRRKQDEEDSITELKKEHSGTPIYRGKPLIAD
jgi:hypothetical protein